MKPGSHWRRLFAALAVSCLLHTVIACIPYLGAHLAASQSSPFSGYEPGRSRVISVTLEREREPAVALVGTPAEGKGAATMAPPPKVEAAPTAVLERAMGIDVLPIPAPTYYTTDQLTKRPQPLSDPKLDIPEISTIFTSGTVILRLWINELGAVASVDLEDSDVAEAISATAVAAFGKLRFVPGEINGRPVGVMMRIEVTYDDNAMPP